MADKFPKQEEKLVNDNGALKWLQRTIYMPGDTGMVVVSPTHRTKMHYGTRLANSPMGLVPISDSVEVERWSNTPTETGNWVLAVYDGDIEKTKQKGRYLWGLPDVRQQAHGGYLTKFDLGGTVQQSESGKQKRMKELLLIINGAAKELSTKQPGDNVAYLAQVIQDPQEAELIEAIVAEIPDAKEVIDQVSQLSSQMFKCGGKTKKKVKKGAKGCIPCKKLMRVGGKLINVLVDCEGKPIHKNAKGGWIVKAEGGIPGGFKYGSDNLLTMDDINKTTGKQGDVRHFFDLNTGLVMQTSWNDLTSSWDPATNSDAKASYGIGDNQINLWKDGYNPATGLKKGETFTYTDRFGITRRANTKDIDGTDALTSVWHQNTDGGERTRKGVGFNDVISTAGDPKGNIKDDLQIIEYMPSAWRLRRAMRDERNRLFWEDVNDNNMSKSKARVQRRQRRLLHENFISGAHRDMKDAQVTTGDSYIDARNKWKAYRKQSLGTNPQKVKPVFDEYKL